MSTRTRGAAGIRPRALAITPQATRGPTLLLLAAMEVRRRAVDHRLLAEVVGSPNRRVPVVRQAAADGEVAGETGRAADADEANSSARSR